jgi:hypothetical protein
MQGLDAFSFIELDPPTARGPASDDDTLKITVFGMPRLSQRAHSHAIAKHERRLGFQRGVALRTRADRFVR